MPTYAIFPNLRQLTMGLHMWLDCDTRFPDEVVSTPDHRWAVEIPMRGSSLEETKRQFLALCEHCAIPASVDGSAGVQVLQSEVHPDGKCHALRSLLGGSWEYHDPQRRVIQPPNAAVPDGHATNSAGTRYVLAARNRDEAQTLLNALTSALVTGIRAVAWPLEPSAGECPFKYFWRVDSQEPPVPLSVLQMAPRVWWGPTVRSRSHVYVEWPWSLYIAPYLLERLYGLEDDGLVLLSKPQDPGRSPESGPEEPDVLTMRRPEGHPDLHPLIDVASLQIRDKLAVETSASATKHEIDFDVELRLVESSGRARQADRIADAKQDIRSRQLLLARMVEEQSDSEAASASAREPLYIYQGIPARRPGTGLALPHPLQRLLIEWSDQKDGLKQLMYQHLPPGSLPQEMIGSSDEAHLLTTKAALRQAGSHENAALWLRDYRPTTGGIVAFDLLPEWVPFGLNIFVPQGLGLSIYPKMRPNEVTASKLAGALCPDGDSDRSKWAILLMQVPGGSLRAHHLRLDSFKPLVDSFDWTCAVNAAVPDRWQEQLESLAPAIEERFLKVVEGAFTQASTSASAPRLRARRKELRERLSALTKSLADMYDTRSLAVRGEHDQRMADLTKQAEALKHDADQRQRTLAQIASHIQRIDSEYQKAGALISQYSQLCGEIMSDLQDKRLGGAQVQRALRDLESLLSALSATQTRLGQAQTGLDQLHPQKPRRTRRR